MARQGLSVSNSTVTGVLHAHSASVAETAAADAISVGEKRRARNSLAKASSASGYVGKVVIFIRAYYTPSRRKKQARELILSRISTPSSSVYKSAPSAILILFCASVPALTSFSLAPRADTVNRSYTVSADYFGEHAAKFLYTAVPLDARHYARFKAGYGIASFAALLVRDRLDAQILYPIADVYRGNAVDPAK